MRALETFQRFETLSVQMRAVVVDAGADDRTLFNVLEDINLFL